MNLIQRTTFSSHPKCLTSYINMLKLMQILTIINDLVVQDDKKNANGNFPKFYLMI